MVHTWEASRLFWLTKDFAKERKNSPLASMSSHQVMPVARYVGVRGDDRHEDHVAGVSDFAHRREHTLVGV